MNNPVPDINKAVAHPQSQNAVGDKRVGAENGKPYVIVVNPQSKNKQKTVGEENPDGRRNQSFSPLAVKTANSGKRKQCACWGEKENTLFKEIPRKPRLVRQTRAGAGVHTAVTLPTDVIPEIFKTADGAVGGNQPRLP